MNLKLKRLVRTTTSEQYALFDLDQMTDDHQPTTIGKIDMHYTNEGIYGTILLWDDVSRGMGVEQRTDLVQILLDEISTPMGVPNEYVFEFFAPTLDEYEVIHNVGLDLLEEDLDLDENEGAHPADFEPEDSVPPAIAEESDIDGNGINAASVREHAAAAEPFDDAA